MRRRIVFLDVNGVLNSTNWSARRGDHNSRSTSVEEARLERIDPEAVARLVRLLAQSQAEVVLSSTWRSFGLEMVERLLSRRGFRGRLLDRTPLPNEHDLELFRRLHGNTGPDPRVWPRGYELQQWLDRQPEVESIAILDDSFTMKHLEPWQVRTSRRDGLLDEHIERALELLDRPGPPRSPKQPKPAPSPSPRPSRARSTSGRRIIFLDVDGVLNSNDWSARAGSYEGMSREQLRLRQIDPDAVARLDRLVAKSKAEVVLCSAWRQFGVDYMNRLLAQRGFRGQLIDRTPLDDEHDLALFRRLRGNAGPDPRIWPRGYELQQWLDGQSDVESIVILDDTFTMKHLDPWQVRTSRRDGLLDEHVERALEILRRPGPPRSAKLREPDPNPEPSTSQHRIIFLDVDGVLNSSNWSERRGDYDAFGMSAEQSRAQRIDPDAVARLDRLVTQSGAEVVLCSAWRDHGIESMRQVLSLRGFRGRLIDRTPVRREHDLELFRRLHGKPGPDPAPWPRGYELQQWLDARPEIQSIVILDDCYTMEHLTPWQVRTSMRDGLLDEHVERALEILRRPGPPRSQEPSKLVTEAPRWRRYLECFDRWWRWIELGREAEAGADTSEADACFAAGCWLQPESAEPVVARVLRQRNPTSDRDLADPNFPQRPAAERHRSAWELGRRGLDALPTLLRWSCDPSPAVRACIHRALGRIGHPAAIEALHEGTLDPDHDARVTAVAARDQIIADWTGNARERANTNPRDDDYHPPDPSSLVEPPTSPSEFEARRKLRFSGQGTLEQRRQQSIRVSL